MLFAIYGNPVSHSKSPHLHNFTFLKLGFLDYCYTRIKLENGNELVDNFKKLKLLGANVTVPFKEDAFRQCDEIVGLAKEIKAVNTIVYKNNKTIGYNTDSIGFLKSIEDFDDVKKVLIIGAGGTAKAIAIALKHNNIQTTILNRSKEKLAYFKEAGIKSDDWNDFKAEDYDLVVNTTSAGLSDDSLPAPIEIINNIFSHTKYAYDVIYNKPTPFLTKANELGLTCKNGKDMLIFQAAFAFMLFSDYPEFNRISNLMKYAMEL